MPGSRLFTRDTAYCRERVCLLSGVKGKESAEIGLGDLEVVPDDNDDNAMTDSAKKGRGLDHATTGARSALEVKVKAMRNAHQAWAMRMIGLIWLVNGGEGKGREGRECWSCMCNCASYVCSF